MPKGSYRLSCQNGLVICHTQLVPSCVISRRSYSLSCHNALAKYIFETGQYENVNEENRLCLLCNDTAIANEEHLILKCRAYNDIRTDLFTSARSIHPNFDNLIDDKLSLILANPDIGSNNVKVCHQIFVK